MRAHQLVGRRFGRLLVVERVPSPDNSTRWRCLCDCGTHHVTKPHPLLKGKTKSCGCYKLSMMRVATLRHGKSGTRTHNIWRGMLKRCQTPTSHAYSNYGGRGIKVCERWQVFENFLADMGESPARYSIERKDVNGHYEKSNCVWMPKNQQAENTRRTLWIEIGGLSKPLSVWCREKGASYSRVRDRIQKLGWEPSRAFTEESHA